MTTYENRDGFTLIELIVVIAILAILAIVLVPLVNEIINKSRISTVMATVQSLEKAGSAFHADIGTYPLDTNKKISESELINNVVNRENWDGPYLNTQTLDDTPWGGTYLVDSNANFTGAINFDWTLLLFAADPDIPGDLVNVVDAKLDGSTDLAVGRVQGSGVLLQVVLAIDVFPLNIQ